MKKINDQKKIILGIVVAFGLIGSGFIGYVAGNYQTAKRSITTFDQCVAAGYPVRESYPAQCSVPGGDSFKQSTSEGQPISIEGHMSCLEHKNTTGPQTLECATGLKTADGTYYKLTGDLDSTLTSTIGSDRNVLVTGTFKQETDTIYTIKGTITVTNYEFIP